MLSQYKCARFVAKKMLLAYVTKAHVEVFLENQANSVLLAQHILFLNHKVTDLP